MPRVSLNVAHQDVQWLRLVDGMLVLVTIMALAGSGYGWWRISTVTAEAEQFEHAAARVAGDAQVLVKETSTGRGRIVKERVAHLIAEVTLANSLPASQAFSWTQFLTDLEETLPSGVLLATVSVDFHTTVITLTGNASTLALLTDLITALERHPAFREVVLSQHRLHDEQGQAPRTDFTLSVHYQLQQMAPS